MPAHMQALAAILLRPRASGGGDAYRRAVLRIDARVRVPLLPTVRSERLSGHGVRPGGHWTRNVRRRSDSGTTPLIHRGSSVVGAQIGYSDARDPIALLLGDPLPDTLQGASFDGRRQGEEGGGRRCGYVGPLLGMCGRMVGLVVWFGERQVALVLLGEVEAEDGVEPVEDSAHLHEVVLVGTFGGQLIEEPTEATDLVADLDMAAAHRPGRVGAAEGARRPPGYSAGSSASSWGRSRREEAVHAAHLGDGRFGGDGCPDRRRPRGADRDRGARHGARR